MSPLLHTLEIPWLNVSPHSARLSHLSELREYVHNEQSQFLQSNPYSTSLVLVFERRVGQWRELRGSRERRQLLIDDDGGVKLLEVNKFTTNYNPFTSQ